MVNKPVRLNKKQDDDIYSFYNSIMDKVEAWVLSHALLCLIVATCILMALFVVLVFILTGVSATESGVTYNQMEAII